MGESNGVDGRGNRISLLWSAVGATIIPKVFVLIWGIRSISISVEEWMGCTK